MASRTVDAWTYWQSLYTGWTKYAGTLTTTGPYIITCMVKGGEPGLGVNCTVDGVTEQSNELFFVCYPDPIQPSTDPFVSFTTAEASHSGTPGQMPSILGTARHSSGMWLARIYDYGAQLGGAYEADYIFDTEADFYTALTNGEITPIETTVYFDVYIDGTDKPSIFVNWVAGEELSPSSLIPKIWIGAQDLGMSPDIEYITDPETGLKLPYTGLWNIDSAGSFSYAGSYSTTFLAIENYFANNLNIITKRLHWGFNGEPEYVKLYLQMINSAPEEGNDGIGELYCVSIAKDGTPSSVKVSGSYDAPGFSTIIRFHTGEPDYVLPDDDPDYPGGSDADGTGPGRYDPDAIPDPDDFTDPTGYDGNAVLTKTYAVSAADLVNIGQKLWSQDYFDVLKIQSNPMENIVSVKWFPFAQTGTSTEVKIGDVAFGVNGAKVPSVKKISITNKFIYSGHFNNFLDFAPFTQVKLFLPYIGFVQLDPGEIYNSPIKIDYFVDLVTGQCMARLYTDVNTQGKGIPFQSFYGNMGVDVPLSSTDRVQTEIRAASVALSSVAGLPGQIMAGDIYGAANKVSQGALNIAGMDYNTQRSSTQSPSCASYDCQDVYAVITRPAADVIQTGSRTGYEHLHGYPTNKYLKLSQIGLGKFVQVDSRTDIQIAGTSEENAMLERMLMEGVYV